MAMTGDAAKLKALADLIPALSDPSVPFGAWAPTRGAGTADDPLEMPAYVMGVLGLAFTGATAGWIEPGLDWPAWRDSSEGRFYLGSNMNIATADVTALSHMLTTLVRSERFVEGTLAEAHASGQLLAIARRAKALLGQRCA